MILERQLEDPVIDERVRDENAELCSEVSEGKGRKDEETSKYKGLWRVLSN